MPATGMTRAQLTGADLTATANVTATSDADVHLHDWQAPISDTEADRSAAREAGQRHVAWGADLA
ncbi:hypothetical protein B9W62_35655 [Streptomyces sp. CS113]|uniref:hypothetical protein n=1 Tax=Streptomyces sp. CS113 TaxID=1982761 RepID=UPI000B411597|nr:hypothetical protein [Streptomyces sp. CS113]OWA00976.1 hypothetical protein B9W62_35655 [Streptomyces sp. CS113]